ncbi:tetratricopeptide repeat protein [Sulfuracidifex metallicus]|uniref:Uncharacterized protein n=1 Tax=Sulfuracidifex metallicus DSM 6482 = JCM 9184 TaxID=523847 RepID=A0A6A9QKQ6_SULME|nr:hypothetical protein [Sulfuracidifex metallicus]MUN29837.1 hypothetical protein [Sulfuracidifex metallicus DSM 6482 = JCM 9184]WOE51778.1 hypothetical protein RQ359_001109 [Sulfuracidifex metallicus DSM 6482 = JCM 9184]
MEEEKDSQQFQDDELKLERGEELFEQGKLEEALSEVKDVKTLGGFMLRFQILEKLGRDEEADHEIRQASQIYPYNYYLHYLLANKEKSEGNFQTALQEIDQALSLLPINTEFLTLKAEILFQLEMYEDVIMVTNEIIKNRPDDVNVRTMRILSYYNVGAFYDALMEVNKALEYSKDGYLHFLKGTVYYHLRYYTLALDELRIAIHMDEDPEYIYWASLCLYFLKRFQEATEYVDRALKKKEKPVYLALKARILREMNDYKAKEFARKAVEMDPSLRKDLQDIIK